MLGAGAGAAAGGAPSGGVGAVPGATAGAIATFAILVGLCGSVIVDTVIKTADVYNIDVLPLKTASFIKDLNDCQKRKLLDWIACGKTLTTILKTMREVAEEKVTNNSEGKVIFEIQPNPNSQQTPDCTQLNLTPEECANIGKLDYSFFDTIIENPAHCSFENGSKSREGNRTFTITFSRTKQLLLHPGLTITAAQENWLEYIFPELHIGRTLFRYIYLQSSRVYSRLYIAKWFGLQYTQRIFSRKIIRQNDYNQPVERQ